MRLVMHIGAGKTGSTSIQNTLSQNDEELKRQGFKYLGLMLERTGNILYPWQRSSSVVQDFHTLDSDDAKEQILNILQPVITESQQTGIHTLIWSNESFLGGKHNFLPALKALQVQGLRVDVIVYVREYLPWSLSAYVQWGIKHKTYSGKLKRFSEWSQQHQPGFFHQMENFLLRMPNSLFVRNMNAVKDVVSDFFNFLGVDSNAMVTIRGNDSPRNEEILLRALFNAKHNDQVLPSVYEAAVGDKVYYDKTPSEFLATLLEPTSDDIQAIANATKEDQEQLNQILLRQGQSPLQGEGLLKKSTEIKSENLLMALADIVMSQSNKISALEHEIRIIKEQ